MIPLSLDSLYEHLTAQKVDVKRQPETKQLYILNKIHNTEYPTFIRVMDEGELLQILAFMPVSLEPKTTPDVARLLHLFNKEIDIPGFGMDEASKVCYYRIVLPGQDNKISGEIVSGYMNSIHVITETFFPVIAAVATGAANYEDILKKANQTIKP